MMKQHHKYPDELLDQLGAEALQAFAASAEEVAETAASPFLYTRIQAHIAERRQVQENGVWFALFGGLWRALPAFALLALLTIGGAFFAGSSARETTATNSVPPASEDNLFFDSNEEQLMSVLFPAQSNAPAEVNRK